MPVLVERPEVRSAQGAALTKAVLRAADKLDVKAAALAPILGVSEATVSRMKKGDYVLQAGTSRAGNEGPGTQVGRQAWSRQPSPPRSPARRGCRQASSLRQGTGPQRGAKLAAHTIEAQTRALRASR